MSKTKRAIYILLMAIVIIGLFSVIAVIIKNFIIPLLPEDLQKLTTLYLGTFILTITILAGFAQITGYSIRDFSFHKKTKPSIKDNDADSKKVTQISGDHKAKGIGEVTGLDIQGPAIIKPGTKSTAEGAGKITATRISDTKDDKE